MSFTRRDVLVAASGLALGCATAKRRRSHGARPLRAVAFDAFALFDPRPFTQALEASFPARGAVIAASYRARLFDYGWLRALGGRYQDFWRVSEDALDATAAAEGLELAPSLRASLLDVWARLPAWPDTVAGIRELAEQGLELAVLSNWSPRMLDGALERSGLREQVRALSTDVARTYKPDPRAYDLAVEALRMTRDEILFVAFAGWDAAGASWSGLPTVWMNRANATREWLDMQGVPEVTSFAELCELVERYSVTERAGD